MRQLLWLSPLFLSTSWLFLLQLFTSGDLILGIIFLAIGIGCAISAVSPFTTSHFPRLTIILLPLLVLMILYLPFPYTMGCIVLFIGLVLSFFPGQLHTSEWYHKITSGMIICGLMLLLQILIFPLYIWFVSHHSTVDILASFVSILGNVFGLQTTVNYGVLIVQTTQQTYLFTLTWEKLGLFLWGNITVGVLFLLFLFNKKKMFLKKLLIFIGISSGYLIVRLLLLIILYNSYGELSYFWDPYIYFVSFIPFILLLIGLVGINDKRAEPSSFLPFTLQKKQYKTLGLLFISCVLLISGFMFQDPGAMKSGRVLIDEYHSDWEDTTQPMNTSWYGVLSTYNYYSMATWISSYYTVTINTNQSFTPDLLHNYDIIILKCPTKSYADDELRALYQYVDQGGGIYLIGDHTNVFGMNTYLNQVAHNFGINFNTDATYELGTGQLSSYTPDTIFFHPIMRNISSFEFMTSCTLKPTSVLASVGLENVIIGNRLISEPGTYSTENFFRETLSSPESEYGYLLQVAAATYGQGRVLAFSDSTVFSSFCFFTDGFQQFTVNALDYLNRTNQYAYLNSVFIIIGFMLFLIVVYLLFHEQKSTIILVMLVACVSGFLITTPFIQEMNAWYYSDVEQQTPYQQVCFDTEYSQYNISLQPSYGLFVDETNYGTFYVWTQRVGYFPSLEQNLEVALEKADVVVIINPIKSFSSGAIQKITTFLERGGRLLLLDSIKNRYSTANELLGSFGLWVQTTDVNHTNINAAVENNVTNTSDPYLLLTPVLEVTGGEPLFTDGDNQSLGRFITVVNETTDAVGKLVVLVDSYSFTDAVMGGPFVEPTDRQKQVYSTQFYIFEEILK